MYNLALQSSRDNAMLYSDVLDVRCYSNERHIT